MWYWIILVIWVVGLPVAWNIVSKKMPSNSTMEKLAAIALWPLTLLLYGIHWLHNR